MALRKKTNPFHFHHRFPNTIGSEKVNKKGVSDQNWWVGGRGHKVDCWHSLGQEIRHPSHIFTLSSIPDYYLRVFFPMKTIFLLLCHAKWAAVEMLSKVIFFRERTTNEHQGELLTTINEPHSVNCSVHHHLIIMHLEVYYTTERHSQSTTFIVTKEDD